MSQHAEAAAQQFGFSPFALAAQQAAHWSPVQVLLQHLEQVSAVQHAAEAAGAAWLLPARAGAAKEAASSDTPSRAEAIYDFISVFLLLNE
jgi:ABC-type hemin transport system substrate-binding protein